MGSLTIREAIATDAPAVQRVARAAWHAVYDDIVGPAEVDETVDSWYDPDRLVADDVAADDRPFLVAEREHPSSSGGQGEGGGAAAAAGVVGFAEAAAGDDPGVWQLYRLYVHPDSWGEGIGTALLEGVEAAVAERGVERFRVEVHADNEVGVGFYEARGFERERTLPDEQFGGQRHVYVTSL